MGVSGAGALFLWVLLRLHRVVRECSHWFTGDPVRPGSQELVSSEVAVQSLALRSLRPASSVFQNFLMGVSTKVCGDEPRSLSQEVSNLSGDPDSVGKERRDPGMSLDEREMPPRAGGARGQVPCATGAARPHSWGPTEWKGHTSLRCWQSAYQSPSELRGFPH